MYAFMPQQSCECYKPRYKPTRLKKRHFTSACCSWRGCGQKSLSQKKCSSFFKKKIKTDRGKGRRDKWKGLKMPSLKAWGTGETALAPCTPQLFHSTCKLAWLEEYLCEGKVGFKEIYFQVSNFPMPLLLTPNAFSLSFPLALSCGWRKASL